MEIQTEIQAGIHRNDRTYKYKFTELNAGIHISRKTIQIYGQIFGQTFTQYYDRLIYQFIIIFI